MVDRIVVHWLYFGKTAHFIYKKFWRNWLKIFDRILINFLKITLLIVEQSDLTQKFKLPKFDNFSI